MKFIISLFLLFVQFGFSQSKDPNEIIDKVVSNFSRVNDYRVDVNIKVDVEFLKVPETKAKIYFKQPDKVHLEADGFAMLPKKGMEFSPSAFFKKDYTGIYEREVELNGVKTSIIKVIPLGDQDEVILSTFWIDQKKRVIRKVESTTKTNGTFTIDFSYDDKIEFPVPAKIVFSFNLDKLNLPTEMDGERNSEKPNNKRMNSDSRTKGKVFINYSNYNINKGIPDSVFEDQKKKSR